MSSLIVRGEKILDFLHAGQMQLLVVLRVEAH